MARSQHFRANVGIAILGNDSHVMAFERSDTPGQWQLPQGGLDIGEEPLEAALREMREETGIASEHVRVTGEYPDWLAYEWPDDLRDDRSDGRRGQVQKWFAVKALPDAAVDLSESDEFVDFRYMTMRELISHVHPMRKEIYSRLDPWLQSLRT